MGPRLTPVDLLQRKDVGVEQLDRIGQPIQVDDPVARGAAVQDVECGQPHGKKVPTISSTGSTAATQDEESGLRVALKRSASALKADGVPFALAGGYALWANGAPEPVHDVDLVLTEQHVEAAVESLSAAGFTIERPPEDWLFKAYLDDALVDVLHRMSGDPVEAGLVESAVEVELLGIRLPVLPPTSVMVAKLRSLTEHYCDFGPLLPVIRAVREQLDWAAVRQVGEENPFAEALLLVLDRLGIAPAGVSHSESGRSSG
jgi:hypothetical protein